MIVLQSGISGFIDDPRNLPKVDFKTFLGTCYLASSQLKLKVIKSSEAYTGSRTLGNYHLVRLSSLIGEEFTRIIFVNAHYPIMAIAQCSEKYQNGVQYDEINPAWNYEIQNQLTAFFEPDYYVLSKDELTRPIYFRYDSRKKQAQIDIENELEPKEINQIYYWKPKILGEIVFNQWD